MAYFIWKKKNVLLYLMALVAPIGTLCQAIPFLLLVMFLLCVVVLYFGSLKNKQTIIANSIMEVELIALALANLVSVSEESTWLRNLLHEILLWKKLIPPILIHYNNTATIGRVQNYNYDGKFGSIKKNIVL